MSEPGNKSVGSLLQLVVVRHHHLHLPPPSYAAIFSLPTASFKRLPLLQLHLTPPRFFLPTTAVAGGPGPALLQLGTTPLVLCLHYRLPRGIQRVFLPNLLFFVNSVNNNILLVILLATPHYSSWCFFRRRHRFPVLCIAKYLPKPSFGYLKRRRFFILSIVDYLAPPHVISFPAR
uniref:Uncharacterized protein n=1 Tax=Opuntia streptacantha TaxID=393608 RepID=A0A7C9EAC8_OPUST